MVAAALEMPLSHLEQLKYPSPGALEKSAYSRFLALPSRWLFPGEVGCREGLYPGGTHRKFWGDRPKRRAVCPARCQVRWETLGRAEAARSRWGHGRSIQEETEIWERGSSNRKQMLTIAVNSTE